MKYRLLLVAISVTGMLTPLQKGWAAATDDFPEWLEKVPGQPVDDDPDKDGVPTFLEYALGAEPEDAVDPFESGSPPIFRRENGSTMVLLPFPGNRDLIYYLEGKTSLNDSDWTVLATKLGNAPWSAVAEGFIIEETADEVTLSFEEWPDATFLRMRAGDESTLQRKALAARFLKQATFGPKMEEIESLADSDLDFEGWIDDQQSLPVGLHLQHYYGYPITNHIFPDRDQIPLGRARVKEAVWWDKAILGEDQLRQRVAWALSQVYVMGEAGSNAQGYPIQWVNYYDIMVRNAFGNLRDLLQEVTLSGKMGYYLTFVNNRKANGAQLPDENYAREVMQLFTIGLWQLNNNGTLKLDAQGEPIPTYNNFNITQMAKVFTGLQYNFPKDIYQRPNRVDPMIVRNDFRHDKTIKFILDGHTLPAGRNTMTDINDTLDVLFNHPNMGPFISYRLIQRLVSSNPSPDFVERVAEVFIDNGQGVRGDLAAVTKAILLDPEARDAGYMIEQGRGKLHEPILKFTQLCRAFNLKSNVQNKNALWFRTFDDDFGMSPYKYPSVFNFYQPEYVPSGDIQDSNLVAPEFQILDDSTGMRTFQIFNILIKEGLTRSVAGGYFPRPTLDYTAELALAPDVPALTDHLDLLLTHQTMSEDTREIIIEAVEAIPSIFTEARVHRAVLLVSISPEFAILE